MRSCVTKEGSLFPTKKGIFRQSHVNVRAAVVSRSSGSGKESVAEDPKGLLNTLHQDSDVEVLELSGSGDYLAFLDEGDPVYVPRGIMDWMRERQEPESFFKRIARQLKKI